MSEMVLACNNLKKSFNNKEVLKGINLEVKEGDLFGFLGRNGAGKSTFINIISGSVNKTSGNFDIVSKKEFGIMPDIANIYPDMSVKSFLTYMANLKNLRIKDKDLNVLLNKVSLDVTLNQKIKGFSFGMKKKLSLAQSIIGNPKLLILDEPTSGIDPESILHIQSLIQTLNKEGVTIFLTSHNLNEIEKLCNYITILKNGKIVINGTIDDLKNKYTKEKLVSIKTDTYLTESQTILFHNLTEINNDTLKFSIMNENDIKNIVKKLVDNNIGIYSIEQSKISLEEIFMM
jgi:ABC-2 type transport system ATP-binding protein